MQKKKSPRFRVANLTTHANFLFFILKKSIDTKNLTNIFTC